jgi:hypothetical protein
MQIDRYTHLQFPRNSAPIPSESESSGTSLRAGLTKPQGQVPTPALKGQTLRPESVVLKVQFPAGATLQATRAEAAVYTDGRKSVDTDVAQADSEMQAADHQRAVDRNVGVFTQLTINKDGVLTAKTQPAGEANPPDFVALAVSAMREFSDEAERQKAQSFDFNAPAAEMPWGRLKGLQQLAAKFNVFA